MVEHERASHDRTSRERTATAPDTDPIPAQSNKAAWPTPQEPTAQPVEQAYHKARSTSGLWIRMTIAVVVLVVLLVFILENLQTASIAFFGAHLHLPLGVSLLLAAIAGVVLVLVPTSGRIMQLRRTLRRAANGR